MEITTIFLLSLLMGLVALLYSSVGHAGASGYLAVMALFSIPASTMRPTALTLNILVASFATYRFVRAGRFNGKLLIPLVLGAVPAAFVAGRVELPGEIYRPLVGVVLWIAAIRLLWPRPLRSLEHPTPPAFPIAVLTGALIGCLSGLTGTGGGIFLSPIILFLGWEDVRRTSGVSSAFILCVSISGLTGSLSSMGELPPYLFYFVLSVMAGAALGTRLGISKLSTGRLLQALGLVLVLAGAKLLFT